MKLLIKETFVSIKVSFKRFLSILLIVLLGVGFFAGIKATSPDMKLTINKYYHETKFQDIELLSTWGVTEDEIIALKEKGYNVEGSYSFDAIVSMDSDEVVKVHSYNKDHDLNKIVLLDGKLPENDSECVIETSQYTKIHTIGDKIIVNSDNLKQKTLTIVGIVKSPIYISLERGSTPLLTGKINYFIYTPESNFNMDYYTNVALYLNQDMFTNKYDSLIEKETKALENITKSFGEDRFNTEKEKAMNKYNENKSDYEKEKKSTNTKIKNAKKELANAKAKYNNGTKELSSAKETFNNEYIKNKAELNSALLQVSDGLNKMNESKIFLENGLISYEENINNINLALTNPSLTTTEINELNKNKVELETLKNSLSLELENIKKQESSLLEQEQTFNDGLKELEVNKELYETEFTNTEKELKKALSTINSTEKTINSNEKKAKKEFAEAEKKLDEALEEIESLEEPTWYVLDRKSNIGFYQFNEDIDRIANLGMLFPLVFFIVAVLICLTSMTRMVEEERNQLGTLKSLGFTNSQILFKYILYALIATIVGSSIGLLIGFKILPDVIFNMYSMMYNVNNIVLDYNLYYAIVGTGAATICTLGATILVCIKSLKEQPAELMRPKSIKSGKRILLEKIPFIWNKLNFNHKVTMRNVFRYKKRMIMTIVGIAGCTGLIIAGFGLKDCITGMVSNQYEDIYRYQLEITLSEDKNNDEVFNQLSKIDNIDKMLKVHKEAVTLNNYDTNQDIQLVVYDGNINEFIELRNPKSKKVYDLDEKGIIVSEKICNLLNIKKQDKIVFSGEDKYVSKVSNITENYMYHFIYMNKDEYQKDEYNTILVKTKKMNEEEEKALATEIQKIDGISKLSFTSSMANIFDSTMKNFEYVVVVLIVSANLLAFVVLYNLASVNISERIRELATVKVLGFYDIEVYRYIGRETTILTFLSMIFGIGTGNLLTTFIIKTCELDMIMFNSELSIMSYVYGIIITILFTIVVNITTYFSLKKIEMIESLKSVE